MIALKLLLIKPIVPIAPIVLYSQSFIKFPAAPPHGKALLLNNTAAVTDNTGRPIIKYLRLRLTEKPF